MEKMAGDHRTPEEKKMRRDQISITSRVLTVFMILFAIGASGVSVADDPPQRTTDGLELVKQTKHRLVYMAPDADISQYTSVSILECFVAFKKNWQRDYNRSSVSLQRRVDDNDMDRIKKRLAAKFKEVFIEVLAEEGKHEVVDHVGPEVLVLRPAIVNLDVTSPDTGMTAGRSRSYNASAGQMTLYLEFYDSVTSTIIAKVMDSEADRGSSSSFMISSSVTNTAAAGRILRGWAEELAGHLGEIKNDGEDAE
jgi:hypothetical protein